MFSFHFQHIFILSLAGRLIYTCFRTFFLTRSQNNMFGIVCAKELKLVCFYMAIFIFKVAALIFCVLGE